MSKDYTRLPVNHEAAKKRRGVLRATSEKNSDLHENYTVKPIYGPRSIRDGIRLATIQGWREAKGGLVYIANGSPYDPSITPSHNIDLLIHSLPKEVAATNTCNEDGSPIMLPVTLPTHYWELSAKTRHTLSDGKKISYGGDIVKPYLYQLALSELETLTKNEYRLTPFTFTTSKALESRIQAQKRERVDFLRDRIQRALSKALQRPKDNQVPFWFALEMAGRGQPHIQGSMLIRPEEQAAVRQVFYKLNGDDEMTPDEKQGCFRFGLTKREELFTKRGRLYTDLNWAGYNLKERARTSRDYNDLKPIVAVSQPLIKPTKDYYRRIRKEFNRQQRAAKKVKPTSISTGTKKPVNHLFGSW